MKEKKLNTLFVIIGLAFALTCIVLLGENFFSDEHGFMYNLEVVFDIIASCAAMAYLVLGYSKDVKNFYKGCMALITANALVITIINTNEKASVLSIVMCALAFAILVFLTFGKDLGKNKSYIASICLLAIRALGLIICLIGDKSAVGYKDNVLFLLGQLSIAVLVLLIIYAKYVDKAARGTK